MSVSKVVVGCLVIGFACALTVSATVNADVSGSVKYEGKPPTPREIDIRSDKYCVDTHKDAPLYQDGAAIGSDGAFADIFVWIDNPPDKKYIAPREPVLLDQLGCRYTTHVFGMMVGQTFMVRNSDETTHNVRGFARVNRVFNFGQPPGLKPRTRVFDKPEMPLKIKCDVHAWMQSYCFVMEHPYFGVTGTDGRFTIEDVPAGTYTLKAWHERLGELEQPVTVGDSGVAGVNFTFRRPKK